MESITKKKEKEAREEKASEREVRLEQNKRAAHDDDKLVCEIDMKLEQVRDDVAIYRPVKSSNDVFVVDEVLVKRSYLPDDPDFNSSFMTPISEDQVTAEKQKKFAKFFKMKVKIEV